MSQSNARRRLMIAVWLLACAPAMGHSIVATRGQAVVYPERIEFVLTMTVPQMAHVYRGDAIDATNPDEEVLTAAAKKFQETVEQSLRVTTAHSERLRPRTSEVSLVGEGKDRQAEVRLVYPFSAPPAVLVLELDKPADAMSAHNWQMALAVRGDGDAETDWSTVRLPSPAGVEILDLTRDAGGMRLGPPSTDDVDLCTLDDRRLTLLGFRVPVAVIDCADREIAVKIYARPFFATQYWQPRPAGAKPLSAETKKSGIDTDVRNLTKALTFFAGPEPLETELLAPASQKIEFVDLEGRVYDSDNPPDAALVQQTARMVITSRYPLPEGARFVQGRWWKSRLAYPSGFARIAVGDKCLSHRFSESSDNYGWFVRP